MYIIIYISKIWSINILVRVYRIGMIKYTLNNTKFHMHNIFYSKRGLNYRISKRTTILFVTSYYTVFTMVKIHTPWIHTQIFIDKLLILFVYSNQLFQYDLHLQIYEIIKYQSDYFCVIFVSIYEIYLFFVNFIKSNLMISYSA